MTVAAPGLRGRFFLFAACVMITITYLYFIHYMTAKPDHRQAIASIVHASVESFAAGFRDRHIAEADNPSGTINMKIHNPFIKALGDEIQYYAAMVRSFDSALGSMIEKMGIAVAELNYDVQRKVQGPLGVRQTQFIAELLEQYKQRTKSPAAEDYQQIRELLRDGDQKSKRHESDYYLIDQEDDKHYLVELKIGGDLDNKKARSEKEALLEQLAILSNTLPAETDVQLVFATAYNRFGEGNAWKQERVRQFFAEGELLIGSSFWNFVTKMDDGYDFILKAYRDKAPVLKNALESIRSRYLG